VLTPGFPRWRAVILRIGACAATGGRPERRSASARKQGGTSVHASVPRRDPTARRASSARPSRCWGEEGALPAPFMLDHGGDLLPRRSATTKKLMRSSRGGSSGRHDRQLGEGGDSPRLQARAPRRARGASRWRRPRRGRSSRPNDGPVAGQAGCPSCRRAAA